MPKSVLKETILIWIIFNAVGIYYLLPKITTTAELLVLIGLNTVLVLLASLPWMFKKDEGE